MAPLEHASKWWTLGVVCIALTPASALAAPWTTPASVPGAVGYRAQLVFTKSGQASLVTDAPGSRALVTAVGGDGRPARRGRSRCLRRC